MKGPDLCDGCGKAMTPVVNHRWKLWYWAESFSVIIVPFDTEEWPEMKGHKTFEACGEECVHKAVGAVMVGKEPVRRYMEPNEGRVP